MVVVGIFSTLVIELTARLESHVRLAQMVSHVLKGLESGDQCKAGELRAPVQFRFDWIPVSLDSIMMLL